MVEAQVQKGHWKGEEGLPSRADNSHTRSASFGRWQQTFLSDSHLRRQDQLSWKIEALCLTSLGFGTIS